MDLTTGYNFGPPHARAIPTGGNEYYVPGDPHGAMWPADGSAVFIREDDSAELDESSYKMEVDPLAGDDDKNILSELVGRMKPEKKFSTNHCAGVKKEEYGDGFNANVKKEEYAEAQYSGGVDEACFLPPNEQLHQYEEKPSVKEETADVKVTYSHGDQYEGFADGSNYHHGNLQTMDINQAYMNSRDVLQKGVYGGGELSARVKEEPDELQYSGGGGESILPTQEKETCDDGFNTDVKEENDDSQYSEGSGERNCTTPEEKPHQNEKNPSDTVNEERDDTMMDSDDDRDVDFGDRSDNENENLQNTDVDETDLTSQHSSQVSKITCASQPEVQCESDGSSEEATSKKIFKCGECDKTYYEAEKYEDHINAHYNIRSYICEVCEAGFFYQRNLDRHLHKVHKRNPDESKHNNKAKHGKKPVKRNHNNEALVTRTKSTHKSNSKHTLNTSTATDMTSSYEIENVNHRPKRLRTTTKATLSQNEEFEYECYECNKTYNDKKKFEDHIDTHLMLTDYVCKKCEESFSSKRFLNEHMKQVHCINCRKKVDKDSLLPKETSKKMSTHETSQGTVREEQNFENHDEAHPRVIENVIEESEGVDLPQEDVYRCETCCKIRQPPKKTNIATCKFCHQNFSKKSIQRHIQRKHPTSDKIHQLEQNMNTAASAHGGKNDKAHPQVTEYVCDVCEERFTSKGYLQSHKIKTHSANCTESTNSQPLMLTPSTRAGPSKSLVTVGSPTGIVSNNHSSFPKENKETCAFCNMIFRKGNMKRHIERMHRKGEYSCDRCSEVFPTTYSLKYHMVKTHLPPTVRCPECDNLFQTRKELEPHLRKSHGIDKRKDCTCEQCGKVFKGRVRLKDHLLTHSRIKTFKCDKCSKEYPTKYHLLRHISNNCSDEFGTVDLLTCEYCLKKCSSFRHVQRHKEVAHFSANTCICDHCSEIFPNKYTITLHMMASHLPPTYKCTECSEMFHLSTKRTTHLRKVHGIDGRRDMCCHQCGEIFNSRHKLERHFLVHSGELPFCCETCGKKFRTESNLKQHLIIHSDVREFLCEVCSKSFKIKHHLRQHMATHGLEKAPQYSKKSHNRSKQSLTHAEDIHGLVVKTEGIVVKTEGMD